MARRGRILLGLLAIVLLLLGTLLALADGYWVARRAPGGPRAPDAPAAEPLPEPAATPPPRWALSGTVTDEDGAPIAGASVDTAREGTPWDGPPGPVRTDDAGRFEIDIGALCSDERFNAYVQAEAPGHQPGFSFYEILKGLADRPVERKCRVVLSRGRCVSGRIVDSSGRPVGGADVRLVAARNLGVAGISFTDSAGRFRVGARGAGPHGISAHAVGYREGWSGQFEVAPDKDMDVGDVVLPDGLVIAGFVRYADGEPVGGARVFGTSGWARTGTFSRTDGAFRLTGLEPGRYRFYLIGWLDPGSATTVECEAGTRDVLMTVRGGRVRLRFVDEKGAPVPDARYSLHQVGDPSPSGRLPNDIAYPEPSYFAPHGSRYLCIATAEGRIPAEEKFEVPSDRNESDVVLRLAPLVPSARVRVELDTPPATPFRARLLTPLGRRHVAVFHGDGEETVFDAPPGSWILVVEAGDPLLPFFEPAETPIELSEDRESRARIDVTAGGRVRLEVKADPFFMAGFKGTLVRAEDGVEIPLKEFLDRPGSPASLSLDARKPTLVRPLLRPGLYRVRVELPRHETYETTIRVDAAAVTDVVAEMVREKE